MEKEPTISKQESQEQNLEHVLSSIMTAEQYAQIQHETPYVFDLKFGDTRLFYFGSPHTGDPKNPLFKDIESAFNEVEPDIVFVEGVNIRGDRERFNERLKSASREEVIEHMGEPGYSLKLAAEKGIEWRSPEPIDEDLYNNLLDKGFSKDHILAWEVLHILPQYNRLMKKEGFKDYVKGSIDRFKQATNWEGFDYSYDHAIKLAQEILGHTIDVENEAEALDYIDPIPWEDKKDTQTIFNRIGEASSLFRDRKIVSDVANSLESYKRVFVVYGASHAVMQEPALRKLIV